MNQIRQLRDSQTYATRSCLLTCEAIRRQVPMVRSVQGMTVTAVRRPDLSVPPPSLRGHMIGLTLALMNETVQVCIETGKQVRRRRGRRRIRPPLSLPIEQFCLCTPMPPRPTTSTRVWLWERAGGSPILEPDLSLTLLHA